MSMDKDATRKVARLSHLEMDEEKLDLMGPQLNGILKWVEQLEEVDTETVEPLANVANIELKLRKDEVNDGGDPDKVLANAAEKVQGFYVVPKVVE